MELLQITYYTGAVLGIILCWNLGPLFYLPMFFNIATDILLDVGILSSGDMRLSWAIIEGLYCLWVLVLANIFKSRAEAVAIFVMIAVAFAYGVYPNLAEAANDWNRWVELTTRIMQAWSIIISGIITLVIVKTLYQWKIGKSINDLAVNPRKRFLIPIWAWATISAMPLEWVPGIGKWLEDYRFAIAGHTLVWGWVLVELKFFVQAWYWRKKYG